MTSWRVLVPVVGPLAMVLVGAFALVQLGILGSGPDAPVRTAPASGGPSAAPSPFDPMHIVLGDATYSISYEEPNIVVRVTDAAGVHVLATAAAPADAFASPPVDEGSSIQGEACGAPGSAAERQLVYGYVDAADPRAYRYDGPPAAGGFADNGLFLFVIKREPGRATTVDLYRHGTTSFDPDQVLGRVAFDGATPAPGDTTSPYDCS